jgi:hypothetical protein
MTYVQGGLIEAQDYNNLLGGNATSNSNTLDAVWAWGNGSRGYGQANLANVSVSGTITAIQWASFINILNSANLHINNTTSGLTANTAGQLIGHSGFLTTAIQRLNQDRLLFATNSAVITNHNSLTAYPAWQVADPQATQTVTRSFGANVAFQSPDRARFFFNAGGRIKFNVSAENNLGAGVAGQRSQAIVNLFNNIGGVALFASNTNAGRTGAGGTLGTNNTALGYYQGTIANTSIVSVTSTTAAYTTDSATLTYRTNGRQGQHNDNGSILSFWINVTNTTGTGAGWNDAIDVTATVTVDVSYPEVTNLANTWGAVTVTRQ